jgi:small subunit ribosomal protein S9
MANVKLEEFVTVGRRKTAVAKVRLSRGTGIWTINGNEVDRSKLSDEINALLLKPFRTIGDDNGLNFRAFVSGGGYMGQVEAIVLGIARAMEKMNPEWRLPLKKAGLLTRDARSKERKKPGRPKARKRFQFSKR